jgi:hypothetical protein
VTEAREQERASKRERDTHGEKERYIDRKRESVCVRERDRETAPHLSLQKAKKRAAAPLGHLPPLCPCGLGFGV